MCGLVGGMSSFLTDYEVGQIRGLMTLAQFRGRDGAGLVAVPNQGTDQVEILRTLGTADELAHGTDFFQMLKDRRMAVLAAHARFPTTGDFDLESVHPFVADHIIGMHNGTLEIVNGHKIGKNDMDSKILFQEIAEHGIDKVIENTKGSYALVWIDKKTRKLNFLRNGQRSLAFAHNEGSYSSLFWASEPRMLWYIFGSNNSKITFRALPEDTLYSFGLGSIHMDDPRPLKQGTVKTSVPVIRNVREIIKDNREKRKAKGQEVTFTPTETSNKGDETLLSRRFREAASQASSGVIEDVPFEDKPGQLHVQYGKDYKYVTTMEKLSKILNDGCLACHDPASYESDLKTNRLHWFARDMFMCPSCWENNPTNRLIAEQISSSKH